MVTEAQDKSGLKLLVYYDRLIGNAYFGWNFNKNLSKVKKYSLIAWNLLVLSLVSIHCYIGLKNSFSSKQSQFSNINYKNNLTETGLPFILFSVSYVTFTSQTLLISLFLLFRGHKILDVLNESPIVKVEPKFERKIGLILVIFNFSSVVLIEFILSLFSYQKIRFNGLKSILTFIYIKVVYFLSVNIQLSVLSFIIYKSFIVWHQFKIIAKIKDLRIIFDLVQKIQESVERFDCLINFYILVNLSVNTLDLISVVCMLAIVPNLSVEKSVSYLLGSSLLLLRFCLFCDIIPNQFEKFLSKTEKKFREIKEKHLSSEQLLNHIILMRLREMKERMGFTAFDLFRVNANILVSCLALIVSYSIIIIQTTLSTSDSQLQKH